MGRTRIAPAMLLLSFLANAARAKEPPPSNETITIAPIRASVDRQAHALAGQTPEQSKQDSCRRRRILKGAAIGGPAGVVLGVIDANVFRDCGTCATTYARSGVVFGSIGAGVGAAIGALAARGCAR